MTVTSERRRADPEGKPLVCRRLWIGDGWHRIMAAKQIGAGDILLEVREGGRAEALKHALGANAAHGHRRTNADKRRCVEIALREFGGMSSRAIAEMCGVSNDFVSRMRPEQVSLKDTSPEPPTVTGADGKSYPAHKAASTNRWARKADAKINLTYTSIAKRVMIKSAVIERARRE